MRLNTVCEEARCPNRSDCYNRGTLTFQILGNLCTRRCGFCAEATGKPNAPELSEPMRIAEAARKLNLSHAVVTAPARDDLEDGGASAFVKTIELLRQGPQKLTIEVLISDLQGDLTALQKVLECFPDVFNHNIETVERLTPQVRAKATYARSLEVLRTASAFFAQKRGQGPCKVKSGVMVGLGETVEELEQTFSDLNQAGVRYLTVGQYLQPSFHHLPVKKFYTGAEFGEIKKVAEKYGFEQIFCGPLVRSSYHAGEMVPTGLREGGLQV